MININVLAIQASVGPFVARRLAVMRSMEVPFAEAAVRITNDLVDYCFEAGLAFLPDEPIEVAHDLLSATVTGICCDYRTEVSISI